MRPDGSPLWSSCVHLRQRYLGLREPQGHPHGTVQVDGSGQGSAGLLPLAGGGIQRAQAAVAVGQERTHAQLFGQRYSLLIGGHGGFDLQGSALRSDLAEQPQGPRLMALMMAVTGACQGALGQLVRVLQAAGQEICFTELGGPERIQAPKSGDSQLYGLFEQWLGLGEAARKHIGITQLSSSELELLPKVRGLTDF